MVITFDNRPQVQRWRDTTTGGFAKRPIEAPPPPPIPEWEIQIEYDYRAFNGPRVSPPLHDTIPIPWLGLKPASLDVLNLIAAHEDEFRRKGIFVFNQSSVVILINESARLAGG